ncbi:MAG: protein kinase [bacterium]|nr:protein kinase [bacterium]
MAERCCGCGAPVAGENEYCEACESKITKVFHGSPSPDEAEFDAAGADPMNGKTTPYNLAGVKPDQHEDKGSTPLSPYSPTPGSSLAPHLISPSAIAAMGPIAGRYRIVRFIGRGGMGEVFEADDLELGEKVALKFLLPQYGADERAIERFKREILLARKVAHPNVCRVFDVGNHIVEVSPGIEHKLVFLSMELLEGETLSAYLRRVGRLSTEDALAIVRQVAAGLDAAHRLGIVHRDLKSSNVILVPTETGSRVVVTDFGLARTQEGGGIDELSATGEVLGTPAYMAPEQVRGEQVTSAVDIYGLGVMLFEMVSGARPFSGPTPLAVAMQRLTTPPPSPRTLVPELDLRWEAAILRCLERDPNRRFQQATEFVHAVTDEPSWSAVRPGPFRISFPGLLDNRVGLSVLLGLVFLVNLVETSLETAMNRHFNVGADLAIQLARAVHRLEGFLSFENHDVTNWFAVYGYCVSYFIVFPLLGLLCAVALARRYDIAPYRVFVLAITFAYFVSLPFFVFFPVPERWSFPDSGAVLLSDLWSSSFIEGVRPISGLDNCFPSFHVSLSTIMIITCFLYRVRGRVAVAALGLTVILSTFVLGIHWLADIAAGLAVGVLGVALAVRIDRRLEARP